SEASKPINVVSAFLALGAAADRSLEAGVGGVIEQRTQRRRVAFGEGFDNGGEGGSRAAAETGEIEVGIGGANGSHARGRAGQYGRPDAARSGGGKRRPRLRLR